MIRWEVDGPIGMATLDRPERRNALTASACRTLADCFVPDGTVRIVVIAGADGVFCAGADLDARRAAAQADAPDDFRPAFDALVMAMRRFPGVIIAAAAGPALGAGTQLVAASDLRIAASDAQFGIPAARLGLHVAALNIGRLVDVVGMSAAEDLLLTARTIDAAAALQMGLVQRVAVDALAEARATADALAALAPLTLSGHKLSLGAFSAFDGSSADARSEIAAREAQAFASADYREALAARDERRPPRFTGS